MHYALRNTETGYELTNLAFMAVGSTFAAAEVSRVAAFTTQHLSTQHTLTTLNKH